MDAIRMNQDHAGKCSIIDEEPNANTTMFLSFERFRRIIMG